MADVVYVRPKPDRRRAFRPDRWLALAQDDVRIVGDGPTVQAAHAAAKDAGEPDPILIRADVAAV